MRELYRMRARQCRASAAATQDLAERYKLERIAWEWDQLADEQGDDLSGSNVIPFEHFLEVRERRERRRARRMAAMAQQANS